MQLVSHQVSKVVNTMRLFSLIFLTGILLFNVAAYVDNCRPDQHYDNQKEVCLDRCGDDNEVICPVHEYCSSNTDWSEQYDPPKCLKRCVKACDAISYCDHATAECHPCDTICDGSNMDACQAYCYDIHIMLPPTTPQGQEKNCNANQYYDYHREVCLDRCGVNNEYQCSVDEFCSASVPWGKGIDPPVCLNHCPHTCHSAAYCDRMTHTCLPCANLCDGANDYLCRIHCFGAYTKPSPATPEPSPENCDITQYFDYKRKICLDLCGVDNELKCSVEQFCSASAPWGNDIDPPVCLNHCPHPCDGVSYCDSISHKCLSCDILCGNTSNDLCRIHCYDVFMDISEPQHGTDVAGTTQQSNIDSSTMANATNAVHKIIIFAVMLVLALIIIIVRLC